VPVEMGRRFGFTHIGKDLLMKYSTWGSVFQRQEGPFGEERAIGRRNT